MISKTKGSERIRKRELDRERTVIPLDVINSLKSFVLEKRLDPSQTRTIFSREIAPWIEVPENSVPVEIFRNNKLSALESVVKYLKEEKEYSFVKIALASGRNSKTIWTTYRRTIKKMPEKFPFIIPSIHIPLLIFKNRMLGVQEAIVKYLKENIGLNYHKIAVLLNRDDRTIWTVYSRVKKKSRKNQASKNK